MPKRLQVLSFRTEEADQLLPQVLPADSSLTQPARLHPQAAQARCRQEGGSANIEAKSCVGCMVAQVSELLKETGLPSRGKQLHGQVVLGQPVCAQAFCRLLGVGHGRYQKLKSGLKRGAVPMDNRFLNRSKHRRVSENRVIVHDYLTEIYEKLAEPMPEASECSMVRRMSFRKRRGKRPRIARVQSKMMTDKGRQQSSMRLLPPGTFSDYAAIWRSRWPTRKISLKLFSAEPWIEFASCATLCPCQCMFSSDVSAMFSIDYSNHNRYTLYIIYTI